jgi:hypothetical protein
LIPQYIDNSVNYGTLVNYTDKANDRIAEMHLTNNRDFYLNVGKRGKNGVICDADWLSTYVVAEHFHVIELLQKHHGFHLINCKRLDLANLAIVDDLNEYDVIIVAYNLYAKVPLDLISSYKVYKIDDMENDPHYTQIARFNIKHSDMVISPYAYVFDDY